MATPEFAQWLARGRTHQWEGRPVDAMLCFRRALRAEPRASDPRFHLGEVLWQLGRIPAAVSTWREASEIAPDHLAPHLALAEALLATGDAAGARDAASRALALAPAQPRAALVAAIAALTVATRSGAAEACDRALAAATDALAAEPALAQIDAIGGPLALALDDVPRSQARDMLLDTIVAAASLPNTVAAMPPQLVAQAIEHAGSDGTALLEAAASRGYTGGDHDALRRIARAARSVRIDAADTLAALYAKVCAQRFAATAPLLWPRRTAGGRLRVIALMTASAGDASAIGAAGDLLRLSAEAFDLVLAVVGADALAPAIGALAASRAPRVIALADAVDVGAARTLAAFDADVLVDLAGLDAATGPLLAPRCARAIVTVASLASPNVAPLVERTVADPGALAVELRAAHADLATAPACSLDAAAIAAVWDDAVRAHQQRDLDAALAGYARVLALMPGYAPALYLAGIAHRDAGRAEDARASFLAAVAAAPDYADARLAAVAAAKSAGDIERAVMLCIDGLERAPANVSLWRALGHAHLAHRDGAAAAAAFDRALALEPTDGETHYNHGVALQMQRQFADAARAYQRALAFRPDLVDADFNLGVMFQQQGAVDAAIAAYENVIARDLKRVGAYKNLGELLIEAGRIDKWIANFRRFEASCPKALPLAVQALEACQYLADFVKLEAYLDGLRNEAFEAADETELADALEQILYLLLYFDVEPDMVLKFAQTYDTTARRVYGETLPRRATRSPGRLRVGYLSADLRNHVMGKMVWSAVEHHDRDRFELYFYSLSAQDDEWTARFRGLAHRFDVIAHIDERDAARRIADDDLDLLIDLSTHTKGAKPGILAFKPARVQITHVASSGTVGLSAIDFKLTDRFADVPENAAFQIEALLPMDGCVYPYRHIEPATDHPFRREALGIVGDTIVIGAFVSGLKLTRRCLSVWRDVLERIPRAKLAFSPVNPALRGLYQRLAAAGGISADRLLFLPQGRNDAENQARYAIIDFVLDPMPYGGVNGVLEPLDAGVPVVTLLGKRHGERTAYSILANLGVTQTVAESGREYADIAARLADDPMFMRDVRASIRVGLAHSPLTDRVAHTRALERAYIAALAAKAPDALASADRP